MPRALGAKLRAIPGSLLKDRSRVSVLAPIVVAITLASSGSASGQTNRVASEQALGVTQCDVLASFPDDPDAVAPPVEDDAFNATAAARECTGSIAKDHENPRLIALHGRVRVHSGDLRAGLANYESAASLGYRHAMYKLGETNIRRAPVGTDLEPWVTWVRRAATLQHPRAIGFIGELFLAGISFNKNVVEAKRWFQKASKLGDRRSSLVLGSLYLVDNPSSPDLETIGHLEESTICRRMMA